MVDNFKLIKLYLHQYKEGECFYHMQILRRGKDHPDLPAANRVIKAYFISGPEYLEKHEKEIKDLCEFFGARAYINLAPKDCTKLAKLAMCDLAKRIFEGDVKKIYKVFNTAAGELKSALPHWVVDIDEIGQLEEIKATIEKINKDSIYCEIPTKSGCHLITKPFNLMEFKNKFPNIDVHKNNPTILYIPKCLN